MDYDFVGGDRRTSLLHFCFTSWGSQQMAVPSFFMFPKFPLLKFPFMYRWSEVCCVHEGKGSRELAFLKLHRPVTGWAKGTLPQY